MPTEQVVTEIIVRGAFEGEADVVAGAGGAERAVDGFTDAQKRTGAAAAETGQRLQETARSYSATARAVDAYVSRQSPAIAAQIQIANELAKVQQIMGGLERQAAKGAISADDQAQRMALLGSRYREVTAAAAGLRDGTVSVGEAMAVLRTEAERAADMQAELAAASQQAARAAQAYRDQVDPLGAAQREYNRVLAETTKLQIAGLITDKEYIAATNQALAVLEKRKAELDGSAQAARDAAVAQAQLAAAEQDAIRRAQAYRDAIDPLGVAQRAHNETLKEATQLQIAGLITDREYIEVTNRSLAALEKKTAELDGSAQAAREAAAAEAQLAAQAKQWIAAADPAAAAQAKLNEQRALGEKLLASGQISQAQYAAGLKVVGDQSTSSAHALRGIGLQLIDVGQQLASGAPPLMTFVQQAGQMAQMAAMAGVSLGQMARGLAGWVAGLLTANPLITVIVAATAAVVALGVASETSARQTIALQNQIRATRDNYVALAADAMAASKAIASSLPGVGPSDARSFTGAIQSSPNFVGDQQQLQQLAVVANNVRIALGIDLPAAGDLFKRMLTNVGSVVQDFADKKMFGFTESLARSITLQEQAGDRAGAFARAIDQLNEKTRNAAENGLTPIGKAMDDLRKAFHDAGTSGVSLAEIVGNIADFAAVQAIKALTDIVREFRQIYDLLANLKPPKDSTASPGQSLLSFFWDMTDESKLAAFLAGQSRGAAGTGPALSRVPAAVQPFIASSAASVGLDPELFARLHLSEGVLNPDGSWKTSSAGAVGPMQIKPGTFAGIIAQPGLYPGARGLSDINNPAQNIQAGAALFAGLLRKYQDVTLAVLAWHDSEDALDRVLASRGTLSPSQDALDQARKIAAGYSGTGLAPSLAADASAPLPIPPIPPDQASGNRYGVRNGVDIDGALKAATAAGGAAVDYQRATAAADEYAAALRALAAQGVTSSGDVDILTEALMKAQKAQYDAIGPAQGIVRELNNQARAADATGTAYLSGRDAVEAATIKVQAQQRVLQAGINPSMREWDGAVKAVAAALTDLRAKLGTEEINKHVLAVDEQTAAQQRILAAWDGSAQSLDHLQNLEKARAEAIAQGLKAGTDQYAESVERLADAYDRGSDATRAFAQAQQSVQAFGSILTNAFDRLKQSMSDAFITGAGHAVNWGNILRSVFGSVATEIAELALLNPVLNDLIPSSSGPRPTLGSALSVLGNGSGAGAAGGGSGGLFGINNLLTVGSAVDKVSGGSLSDWLGLSDIGSKLGLTGNNGLFSGVSNLLNTPIFGADSLFGGASIASTASGLTPAGAGLGAFDAAGTGAAAAAGPSVSLGSVLGGVGLGFGAGSLAGGFVQNAVGKTGYGPEIGAGAGAAIGTAAVALAPETFGISLIVGGLIGGLLGGAGGGLIGPPAPNKYSATSFLVDNGMLVTGTTGNQIYDSNLGATVQELAQIDTVLQQLGLLVNSVELPEGKTQIVGYDAKHPDLAGSGMVAHSISEAFGSFRFASQDDPLLTQAIVGQQFTDLNSLAQYVQQFKATQAGLADFLANTIPQLVKFDAVGGTMAPQLAAINAQFDAATVALRRYASSGAATAEQLAQLSQAETDLANARQRALQAVQDAARTQLQAANDNLTARYLTAHATITGSPEDARTAALFAFDVQAAAQRQQFSDQMVAVWGDAIKTTQGYVDELAYLDRASWEERLATAKQFDDQISQASAAALAANDNAARTAAGAIGSITDFLHSLQTGDLSPLSTQSKYDLASRQFDTSFAAALGGDFNALSGITGVAGDLLTASRAVSGSGIGFVADINRVTQALGKLADKSPDDLIASVIRSESRTSTQQIVGAVQTLTAEVTALRNEVRQQNNRPAPMSQAA